MNGLIKFPKAETADVGDTHIFARSARLGNTGGILRPNTVQIRIESRCDALSDQIYARNSIDHYTTSR